MRFLTRLITLLVAIAAVSASAAPLELMSPAAGSTLRGGSVASVRWSADELPAEVEEWEAFLSVNGGDFYAVRITPHLDRELQEFSFVVPNIATTEARILIRVGDEKKETEFESDSTFSIVAIASVPSVIPAPARARGPEAAREGDAEVIAWVEGSRDGTEVSSYAAPQRRGESIDGRTTTSNAAPVESSTQASSVAPLVSSSRLATDRVISRRRNPARRQSDLLALYRRLNI